MRQVDGAFDVAPRIKRFPSDIQQNKIHSVIGDGVVDIPTIGFEFG
jgi:hypothetical protein